MRVTVCQLDTNMRKRHDDLQRLAEYAQGEKSDLVLLPEMPLCSWFSAASTFDETTWDAAVAMDEELLPTLDVLRPATVLSSRPVNRGGQRINQAYVWTGAAEAVHEKYYLPNDAGFWEATWYHRGDGDFSLTTVGEAKVGFTLCTEIWFMERAREYGQQGAHIIAAPRATGAESVEKWLVGGRAAAVISGAYHLSSNHAGQYNGVQFGGRGWIINPNGEVLALTTDDAPFATVEIDLAFAEAAKNDYPRDVMAD